MKISCFKICFILFFCFQKVGYGHGDHHEKIAYFSEKIKENPDKADNYYYRAIEYQEHGDFKEAKMDFFKTLSLKGEGEFPVYLNMAALYRVHNKCDSALMFINQYLKHGNVNAKGYQVKARIFADQGRNHKASKFYKKMQGLTGDCTLQMFTEASDYYKDQNDLKKAVNSLEQALEFLGPLVTVQLQLVDLKLTQGSFIEAHQIMEEVISNSNRKETYLVKKADLYLLEGEKQNALKYYRLAQEEINHLNQNKKSTLHINSLERKIKEKVKFIEGTIY